MPGYLFVEMPNGPLDWFTLRACQGVKGVLGVTDTRGEKATVFKTKADAARAIAGNGGISEPPIPIEAPSEALVTELVEDGPLSSLEAAIKKYAASADQEEDETDTAVALRMTEHVAIKGKSKTD